MNYSSEMNCNEWWSAYTADSSIIYELCWSQSFRIMGWQIRYLGAEAVFRLSARFSELLTNQLFVHRTDRRIIPGLWAGKDSLSSVSDCPLDFAELLLNHSLSSISRDDSLYHFPPEVGKLDFRKTFPPERAPRQIARNRQLRGSNYCHDLTCDSLFEPCWKENLRTPIEVEARNLSESSHSIKNSGEPVNSRGSESADPIDESGERDWSRFLEFFDLDTCNSAKCGSVLCGGICWTKINQFNFPLWIVPQYAH